MGVVGERASSTPRVDPTAPSLPLPTTDRRIRLVDAMPPTDAATERLAYRRKEAARLFGISVRAWDQLVSAGIAPKADLVLGRGRLRLWSRALLVRWIADGGRATK
jgi:hypothetical protein